jgi:Ca2+-binding RTX toxin-like protein
VPTPEPEPTPQPVPTPEPVPDTRTIITDEPRFRVEGTDAERVEAAEDAGRVWILGDEGDTEMVGNAASNVLVSGGGADVMTGGGGADYFAFQRTDPAANATITDFDAQDKLLLDDQFFGLGDSRTDLRALSPADVRGLLNDGLASFSLRRKELSVDIDGPGGPGGLEVIATFEGPLRLGIDDVMLF